MEVSGAISTLSGGKVEVSGEVSILSGGKANVTGELQTSTNDFRKTP